MTKYGAKSPPSGSRQPQNRKVLGVTTPNNQGQTEPARDLKVLLSDEKLLSIPEAADILGLVVTKVHDLLNTNKLVAYRADGKKYIPAALLSEDGSLSKFVSGAITVLKDNHFSDEEILRFLYTEDPSLPGRPVDALHGHGAREVIRRAQAMAF